MTDLFPEIVETDRLRLERLCRENVSALEFYDAFGARAAVEEVFEHVHQSPYETPKAALDPIEEAEACWNDDTAAKYAIRPKAGEPQAGEFAGFTALHTQWDRRTGRLGLILRKPFWGRGYSGERAAALMEVAFDRLDLEVVATGYNDGNENSRRAIEKYVERFGGRYEGLVRNRVPLGDRVADMHRYTVSRDEWRKATE